MTNEDVVTTNNCWYTYNGQNYVLSGIDFRLGKGELVGMAGENGSGKTTLVKHFNGILRPSKGSVTVFGKDTTRISMARLSADVGYVWQNPNQQIFARTIREEIEFGPRNLHRFFRQITSEEVDTRVEEALEKFGFKQRAESSPYSLTYGERKFLCIASIWAMRPRLFIIDEPTTGVDPSTANKLREIIEELHREGCTVVTISHDIHFLTFFHRLVIMHDGKILLDGPTRKVFTNIDTIRVAGVDRPQVAELSSRLGDMPEDCLTPEEFANAFIHVYQTRKRVEK